jgi:hypothetical protein
MGRDNSNLRIAGGFTLVLNKLINDKRLTPLTRFVWIWMASRPRKRRDGTSWVFRQSTIAVELGIGRRQLQTMFRRLIAYGYIKSDGQVRIGGRWSETRYKIPVIYLQEYVRQALESVNDGNHCDTVVSENGNGGNPQLAGTPPWVLHGGTVEDPLNNNRGTRPPNSLLLVAEGETPSKAESRAQRKSNNASASEPLSACSLALTVGSRGASAPLPPGTPPNGTAEQPEKKDTQYPHFQASQPAAPGCQTDKPNGKPITPTLRLTRDRGSSARVLAILRHKPNGLPTAEIIRAAELSSRNAADVMLHNLERKGEIERVDRGWYGLPGVHEAWLRSTWGNRHSTMQPST